MGLLELGCGISSRPDEMILRPDQVFLIQWDFLQARCNETECSDGMVLRPDQVFLIQWNFLQTSSNGFTARPGLRVSVEFSSDQF
jgi:hypothetical protein